MLPRPSTASQRGIKFRSEPFLARFRRIRRRVLFPSSPSDSVADPSSGSSTTDSKEQNAQAKKTFEAQRREEDEAADWELDQVVVETGFDHMTTTGNQYAKGSVSDKDASDPLRTTGVDHSELAESIMHGQSFNRLKSLSQVVYSVLHNFFGLRFVEPDAEEQFQRERWHDTKFLAWLATAFMLLNWILYLIFNHSNSLYEKAAYYGVGAVVTLPLPVLVGINAPRRHPMFFQIFLMLSSWFWGISESIQMKVCGFYTPHRDCGNKDFLYMMTYSVALPALVLFSFNQKRLFATFGAVVQFILLSALILPTQSVFVRNVISYAVFLAFFITLHYYREQIDRRMFILRSQLKTSFKAQQKAQIAEKDAASSKKRFVSYIFHEVRVPLNSALLAFQNLQANSAFKYCEDEQAIEIHALEGSLTMMQQVLNDVLDLQRMDSGRFESSALPFPFHRTLQSMLGTLRVATMAKNLHLNIEFDERIDKCSATPMDDPHGTWLIGDPMRLRQVLSNLTSNAVKFTPEGSGAITVKTILVASHHPFEQHAQVSYSDQTRHTSSSFEIVGPSRIQLQEPIPPGNTENEQRKSITVRIEVADSGPGIRPSDLREARLFTPFVQTRLGISQAGEGSGLGLAIVRQIVTLSGGRLGVQSRKGQGATFWVEFRFPLATAEEIGGHRATNLPSSDMLSDESLQNLEPSVVIESQPQIVPRDTSDLASPESDQVNTRVEPPSGIIEHPLIPLVKSLSKTEPERFGPAESERPLNVLVVDDDELTRTLMKRMLTRLGCQVHTANDGQHFLNILLGTGEPGDPGATPPRFFDLVSLDNAMPIMTGQEAVKELRAAGRRDFVVGVTGNALKADQAAYLKAGADDILAKPVMMKSLKAMLRIAAERRNAVQMP